MNYRTTVEVPGDDQDNFPDMTAQVDEDGSLTITDFEMTIETRYAPDEWLTVTVEKI